MSVTLNDLRALFPNHFSRRGTSAASGDGRSWQTLELNKLRVLGPFWSIVVTVDKLAEGGFDVGLLAELDEAEDAPVQGGDDVAYHPASALRVQPTGLWNDEDTVFNEPDTRNNSRLSLIAATTYARAQQGALELPFVAASGDSEGSGLSTEQPQLLLRPLGRLPLHTARQDRRFLTATQLTGGWIATRARSAYMSVLRSALGVTAPEADAEALYFLPDGVGFRATMALPWQSQPITAWFRLGLREDDPTRGTLRIWRKPGAEDQDVALAQAVAMLADRLSFANLDAPRWMSLTATRDITADNLFWPTEAQENTILQQRSSSAGCWLDGKAVELRLTAEGVTSEADQMTVHLPSLKLGGTVEQLTLETAETLMAPQSGRMDEALAGTAATYKYRAPEDQDDADTASSEPATEELILGTGPNREMRLVLPGLATAQELGGALGIEPTKEPSMLWLHTPVDQGWLHWPIPYPTTENTYLLTQDAETPARQLKSLTSGRFQLSPTDDKAVLERDWRLSLSRATGLLLSVTLTADKVLNADLELSGVTAAFDGAVPVTVFRQSVERLVPDGVARALRTQGLTAVTPSQLSDLEARLVSKGLVTRVCVRGAVIRAGANGAPSLAKAAGGEVTVELPETGWRPANTVLNPWVWLRHGTLPFVQTAAMSETGGAETQPSANRELSPFVLPQPEGVSQHIKFSNLAGMATAAPALALDNLKAQRPTQGIGWIDEAGMTPTTLSNAVVEPGLDNDAAHPLRDGFWSGLDTPCRVTIRHDIPNTDGLWTQAKLPPPLSEEAEDKDSASPLGFAPQPDNGPGAPGDTDNAWRGVWAARSRGLALAALDRREMVTREASPPGGTFTSWAPNLLGDLRLPVSEIALSETIALDLDTLEPALDYVGAVTFSMGNGSGQSHNVELRGLPAVTALEGLNGSFTRADGSAVTVRLGTLRAETGTGEATPAGLVDQLGLTSKGVVEVRSGRILNRVVERHLPGEATPKSWTLVTVLHNDLQSGNLTLTLVDVPFETGQNETALDAFWRAEDGTMPDTLIDAAGLDANHLGGFAWGISSRDETDPDLPMGAFLHKNWILAPRALHKVKLSSNGDVRWAEVWCQAFVRSWSDADASYLPTGGQVIMGFGRTPPVGSFDKVRLPIADVAKVGGVVPMLTIDSATKTRLDFTFGDRAFDIEGFVDQEMRHKRFYTDEDPDHDDGTCILSKIEAEFDHVAAPPKDPTVDAEFAAQTSLLAVRWSDRLSFDLKFTIDLLSSKVTKGTIGFSLFGASLSCKLRDSSLYDGARATFDFEATPGAGTVFGLPIRSFTGTVFAGSTLDTVYEGHPRFTLSAKALIGVLEIGDDDTALRLEINTLEKPRVATLSGTLKCTGLQEWPTLAINDQTATWVPDAVRQATVATVVFDEALVPLNPNIEQPVRARALVTHHLSNDLAVEALQTVTLYGHSALSQTLDRMAKGTASLTPQIAPSSTAPVHLHDSIATQLPAGIGPVTLASLQQLVKDNEAVGAIDLSGHHVLGESDDLVALPMFAVLGAKVTDPVAAPAMLQEFALPPKLRLPLPTAAIETGTESAARQNAAERTPGRLTFAPRTKLTAPPGSQTAVEHLMRVEVAANLAALRAEAQSEATLRARSLDPSITVRHGDEPDGYAGPASPWDLNSPNYTPAVYYAMWRLIAQEMPLPMAVLPTRLAETPGPALTRTWALRVYVLSQDAQRVDLVGATTFDMAASVSSLLRADDKWATWAQTVMRRKAPHARYGVLLAQDIAAGKTMLRETLSINGQQGRSRPNAALSKGVQITAPQGQYRPFLGVDYMPLRANFGYEPHAVSALALTSDAPHEDGISQSTNRLTETGTSRSLRLSGQDQRILTNGAWVVSRGATAFRRGNDDSAPAGKLRPALPPNSNAALSGPFVAGTRGVSSEPPDTSETARYFVPPYIEETVVGGRPGAWEVARHSIETHDKRPYWRQRTVIQSAQVPVWLKGAAPIELGANDRTRASSYELAHMAVEMQPTTVLHGPAAPASEARVGLDRAPRSAWASTLTLLAPNAGILPRNWDGSLTLVARHFKSDDPEAEDADSEIPPDWKLSSALIAAEGIRLRWMGAKDPTLVDRTHFSLRGFALDSGEATVADPSATPAQTPVSRVASLPPATPVQLTLLLAAGGLKRLVVFELLTAGDGARLPQTPLFFRFDDPAYNDRLTGLAKLDRIDGTVVGSELIFAADTEDLRPSDFVTFAIGHRTPGVPDDPDLPGDVYLSLARRRPGEDGVAPLVFPPDIVNGPWLTELKMTPRPDDASSASTAFQLSEVRLKADQGNATPLQTGDRLEATATVGSKKITLRFDIVTRPNLPENPTFYGIHRLDFDMGTNPGAALSVPLSGFGVAPGNIELVDPTELLRGSVRRRAVNLWRLFEPRSQNDRRLYALQKRTRKGASWLPSGIQIDWQEPAVVLPSTEELDAADDVVLPS